MIIPAEFQLFNQTIKVKYSRTLIDKKGAFGLWYETKNTIYLQQSTRKQFPRQSALTFRSLSYRLLL